MNKNRIFGIIVSILLSNIALAQSDFRPGYYINLEEDTTFGLIDYRGDILNAKHCSFKSDENAEIKKLSPQEIHSYRFIDSKYYISKEVPTKNGSQLFFLEYILNGVTSLYYYKSPQDKRTHYFIEKEDKLIELINEEITIEVENRGQAKKYNNKHIGILKATFADCKEIQKHINGVEMNHKSLIGITKKYHDYTCDGESCIIYEKKNKNTQFAPYIGLSINYIDFFEAYLFSGLDYNKYFSPTIGAMIIMSPTWINEKITFAFDININKFDFNGKTEVGVLNSYVPSKSHFKGLLINPSFGINYTFPKGKIKPIVGFGGIFRMLVKKEASIIDEYSNELYPGQYENVKLPRYLYGGYVQTGCDYELKNNHTIFLLVRMAMTKGEIIAESTKLHSINLSLGMKF